MRRFVPFLVAFLRIFGMFQAYNLLTLYNMEPLLFAFCTLGISVVFYVIVDGVWSNKFSANLADLAIKSKILLFLHGVWSSLNLVMLFTVIGKIHPFRCVVGEFGEVIVGLSLWSCRETIGGLKSNRWCALCFAAAAFLLLGWANDIAMPPVPKGNDVFIHRMGSLH